jgi:ABC-type multidrug transport system fused ATPase/permease subunit
VKLFAAEKLEERQFDKINNNILTSASRAKIARGLFMAGISLSVNTSLFSVLYFGGSLVGSNDLTIGSLASFALYSGFMGLGFSQLSSVFGDLRRTRESSKTLFELLEDPPNLEKSPKQNKLKSVKGDIKFDCVSFCYPSRPENLVLRDFTLNVKPGEVVAIVGRSGAGKSTTAALLTKLFSPSGGTIFLDGVDLATLDTSWLRRQIGVVNQVRKCNVNFFLS